MNKQEVPDPDPKTILIPHSQRLTEEEKHALAIKIRRASPWEMSDWIDSLSEMDKLKYGPFLKELAKRIKENLNKQKQ
jgi:hypothetical protein